MGKGGRVACIILPMILTAASVISLLHIGIGGMNTSDSLENSLYFFKVNTTNHTITSNGFEVNNKPVGPQVTNVSMDGSINIADVWYVYYDTYCAGTQNGTITFCAPRSTFFWFNPQSVWGLNEDMANQLFGSELQHTLNDAYKHAAHWMWVAFLIAIVSSATTFVVGFSAIFSRWGSFVTFGFAGLATFFTMAWAATVTAIYVVLDGAFHTALNRYDISTSLGGKSLALTWIACALSTFAGLGWIVSICCCSGRSKQQSVKRQNTIYERVPNPSVYPIQQQQQYFSQQKSSNIATPYEGFRQLQQVQYYS